MQSIVKCTKLAWRRTPDPSSRQLKQLLCYPHSLTACLRRNFPTMHIAQHHQGRHLLCLAEAKLLGYSRRRYVIEREIVMHYQRQPLIYARTLLPLSLKATPHHVLLQLGKKPLGDYLFKPPAWHRSAFVYRAVPDFAYPRFALAKQAVWMRRSLFTQGSARLLLVEVFLAELLSTTKLDILHAMS